MGVRLSDNAVTANSGRVVVEQGRFTILMEPSERVRAQISDLNKTRQLAVDKQWRFDNQWDVTIQRVPLAWKLRISVVSLWATVAL